MPQNRTRQIEQSGRRLVVSFLVTFALVLGANVPASLANSSAPHWSVPVRVVATTPSVQVSYTVSCPTSTWCVAVNGLGQAIYWKGARWSPPQNVGSHGSLTSVSCATTVYCVAMGQGRSFLYNGHGWSRSITLRSAATFHVSCPATTFCAAAGANAVPGKRSTLATFNGRSWTIHLVSTTAALTDRYLSVSCASAHFCEAVNLNGATATFDGIHWVTNTRRELAGLTSVSCPANGACVALSDTGKSLVLRGTRWSSPVAMTGFKNSLGYSISCASASRCVAIGLDGHATTWTSSGWSVPVVVFAGGYHSGVNVSCAPSGTCLAVNDAGQSSARY